MSEALYPTPNQDASQPLEVPVNSEVNGNLPPEAALARAMAMVEANLLVQNRRAIKHHETSGY